jgi:uncharacterized membrane protein
MEKSAILMIYRTITVKKVNQILKNSNTWFPFSLSLIPQLSSMSEKHGTIYYTYDKDK